jgi:hypothetical protein
VDLELQHRNSGNNNKGKLHSFRLGKPGGSSKAGSIALKVLARWGRELPENYCGLLNLLSLEAPKALHWSLAIFTFSKNF